MAYSMQLAADGTTIGAGMDPEMPDAFQSVDVELGDDIEEDDFDFKKSMEVELEENPDKIPSKKTRKEVLE